MLSIGWAVEEWRLRKTAAHHREPAMRKILLPGLVGGLIAALLIGSVKARDLDVSVMPLAAGRIG